MQIQIQSRFIATIFRHDLQSTQGALCNFTFLCSENRRKIEDRIYNRPEDCVQKTSIVYFRAPEVYFYRVCQSYFKDDLQTLPFVSLFYTLGCQK